jgi:ABC-type transporter Mla MlaB component
MALAVAPGDHACAIFDTDVDHARTVGEVARAAFARGDRLFYLADRSDEDTVHDLLAETGSDRDVQVLHSSQMGLDGGFDRDRQMAVWAQLVETAQDDGYRGLAVVAEMTWALSWNVGTQALLDYEATAAPAFADRRMSAVCLYDRRAFGEEITHGAAHVHPYAVETSGRDFQARYKRMGIDWDDAGRTMLLRGEVDLGNAAFLGAQLADLLATGDAVADCSRLRFIDVAGCRLLHRSAHVPVGEGRLEIRNPPHGLERVLSLIDWAES